ncbi:hypothetical protein BD560DRAFT_197121 [Blakeslea trispora]|nr:hypothetical protein BD560DRAFT_197121 [Blakeslea trispora]
MSQQNSNASSYSPLFTQKKPFNCLPIRKRPPIQTTIRTPKKQYVKLLELEKQRLQQCEDNQPLEETPEYPPTPGSHSSSSSHETASHPSSSLPYLMSSSLKKRPLKKAYLQNKATSLSVTKTNRVIRLPGNPLLWNNGSSDRYGPEMSTEDTINSFKLAWLEDSQESSQDETAVQEDTMVKVWR